MLNQKQPNYNTFVKELARGCPYSTEDGDADLVIAVTNTGLASRRLLAL